ncbi:MAG: 50S ribosomal protein L23 [Candidatus Gracilibacteria bacterium]
MKLTPIVSEKTSLLEAVRVYTFKVPTTANKIEVKKEIEKTFEVSVAKVAILSVKSKKRIVGRGKTLTRRQAQKKALVFLAKNSKEIDFEKLK